MKEKILIIEDEPLIRNELKTLLQSNGYETAAPEDFSDVIDRIRAEQPHLILLDIKLPGTSGFSLCTEVRTFSELPIIFVTSCNTDMDELNSIMLGGDAFITKPYNTAILLAKIASLLKKRLSRTAKGTDRLWRCGAASGIQQSGLSWTERRTYQERIENSLLPVQERRKNLFSWRYD